MAGRKRRRRGEGSVVYRAREKRWRGALYVDGVPHYVYGKTEDEVIDALDELRDRVRKNQPIVTRSMTVAAYLEQWLTDSAAASVRPSTLESYRHHVKAYLTPALGRTRIDRLTPAQVQHLIADLKSGKVRGVKGKTRPVLSPATIQRVRATLRKALNVAMRSGLIAQNPATLVEMPSVPRPTHHPLEPEQLAAFLDACEDHPMGPIYLIAVTTGMRLGEILGLRWEYDDAGLRVQDVDLERGWITVRYQLQRQDHQYVFVPPKSEESRRKLAIGDMAHEALLEQRARQQSWQKYGPSAKPETSSKVKIEWPDHGLVFTTPVGNPLHPSHVRKVFLRILAAADLPRIRLHDLRHSFASLSLNQGATLKDVKDALGHSQISLTADLYGESYDADRRRVASYVDGVLKRARTQGQRRRESAS